MERLTFEGNFCDIAQCEGEYRMTSACADGACYQRKVWERLKMYEDTELSPEICAEYKKFEDEAISKGVPFSRIIELMEADEDGRLVVLPCKVGETVYVAMMERIFGFEVISILLHGNTPTFKAQHGIRFVWVFGVDDIGKTVFLTREEAEAALAGGGVDD